MSAPRDNSSDNDDDIAAIVNLKNEFFYTHFFDESDTNSDDDADLMVVVATILNEDKKRRLHASMEGLREGASRQSGPQPGERPRIALRRLLPPRNGVVPKLFLVPFPDVEEVIWANH
jgi:hypothetical protein